MRPANPEGGGDMSFPGGMEWVLIVLVILLLFGAKKIPEFAKGLGIGIKEFKKATKEGDAEVKAEEPKKEIEGKS